MQTTKNRKEKKRPRLSPAFSITFLNVFCQKFNFGNDCMVVVFSRFGEVSLLLKNCLQKIQLTMEFRNLGYSFRK